MIGLLRTPSYKPPKIIMTKRFPLSLRFSIPLILFTCGGLLGITCFHEEVIQSNNTQTVNAQNYLKIYAGQTARILDYLERINDLDHSHHIEDAQSRVISQLGGDVNLTLAMKIDEHNIIRFANHYELQGTSITNTKAAVYSVHFDSVREKLAGEILLSKDQKKLIAVYPLVLQILPNEIRPSRIGILLIEYDLTIVQREAFKAALNRSLMFNGGLTIFCLGLWFFFELTLTRRVSALVSASNSLAEGNLDVRTKLTGSDELMQISIAFDRMASKIQENAHILQKSNHELALSNQELARATRLKDEFLSNMSHELRTPLNAILGMSEALQEEVFGTLNQKQHHSIKTIESSGNHLLSLINDILDVAKIESGKFELNRTPTSINKLCESSLLFIKQQAQQKYIQIQTEIPHGLTDLFVDERRIRQVLINLLNNAIKFTPEGGQVSLKVTLESCPFSSTETDLPTHQIWFAVTDNGIGITPENIPKLFQSFVQIDSALNRQYEGTGLGLTLVKKIVEIHGGKVEVSSKIGVGSCFSFYLPCNDLLLQKPKSPSLQSPNLDQNFTTHILEKLPMILLAEDNEANIITLSHYLKAKGYQLISAKNGQEAIDLAKANNPDLILMDIHMPGMDGLEAIKWIRQESDAPLADIPIIALTALAMTGDQEKCLEAGANHYLTKPIKLSQLTSIIQQILLKANI